MLRPKIAAPLALLLVMAGACGFSRSFEVRGRVVGFGDDGRTVIVEHEEVEGLMPPMTMPFKTTRPGLLEDVTRGAAVQFTLHVSRDSSWITDLTPLPDDAVAAHPAGSDVQAQNVSSGTPLLEEGDALSPFTLVDQRADTLRLADFEGQALLITFIYTRCPLPEYCPLMSQRFATLQPTLEQRYGTRVQLLSVSFDPEYDRPHVLADYAERYGADPATWTFATGTPDEIARLTGQFGVYYEEGTGQFVHNLTTALVGPDGRVRRLWRGNDWTTEGVLQAVAAVTDDARP